MLQARTTKHALNIIDRPLARNKLDIPTVSLSAFAYLFSELISYAMDRAASITELEDRWGRVLQTPVCSTLCCPSVLQPARMQPHVAPSGAVLVTALHVHHDISPSTHVWAVGRGRPRPVLQQQRAAGPPCVS